MKAPEKKNQRERKVIREYASQGYEVFAKGWPDLLVIKGKEIIAIEVKRTQRRPTKNMGLSAHQKAVHSILRQAGIRVEVRYEE